MLRSRLGDQRETLTSCYQLPAISSAYIECLHLRFSISGAPSTSLKLLAIVKFLMELQCILRFQFATFKFLEEREMFQSPMWFRWDDNFLPTPLKTTHSNPPRHKQPKAWFNSPLFDVWATVEWLTEFNLKCIFKCSPSRDKLIRLAGCCLGWPGESFRLKFLFQIWLSKIFWSIWNNFLSFIVNLVTLATRISLELPKKCFPCGFRRFAICHERNFLEYLIEPYRARGQRSRRWAIHSERQFSNLFPAYSEHFIW